MPYIPRHPLQGRTVSQSPVLRYTDGNRCPTVQIVGDNDLVPLLLEIHISDRLGASGDPAAKGQDQ